MTTPLSNTSSNQTPDYSRETEQIQAKKGSSEGSASKGATLVKDSLEVRYEKMKPLHASEAEAGRPFLPPLFRTRFVEDRQVEDLSQEYYQTLRNGLSDRLKEKLERDEAQTTLSDRDPDLIALDNSLKFEAHLLALADRLAIPSANDEKTQLGVQQLMALPGLVQQELVSYGSTVAHFLDRYLATMSFNDPSYEILLNVSHQIKEALELLSLNRGTATG
jgi:hypothetical protein